MLLTVWLLFNETIARRRSATLLSEFGFGHVHEYAPFGPGGALVPCVHLALILSALHLILRAKSLHI